MANRPSSYLNWTDGSPSKVVQPPSNFLLQGWQAGQAPPFQYANWQIWLADQWIQYLDQLTNTGIPDQAIRLINGGTVAFNVATGALSWSSDLNLSIPSIPDSANTLAAGSATLADGQVAYVTANLPVESQGSTTSGSNVISGMNFTGNITTGMIVTGPGIPGSTTISGVGPNSVTISNNASSTNSNANYTFVNSTALSATVVANTAFIPNLNTIMIARRSGNTLYFGVNYGLVLGGSSSGGGGGSFELYLPDSQAASEGQINDTAYYEFNEADSQLILAEIIVPSSYSPGTQIFLKQGIFASPATTGNVLLQAISYLQSLGSSTLGSQTNSHASTNSAVNVNASANVLTAVGSLDVTDSTGKINGVSVAPGDVILVAVMRGTDSAADVARLLKNSLSPTF